MMLELNEKECEFLAELLEDRIKELHPEIRRCMDHIYKDILKEKLACYEGLLQQVKAKPAGSD